MYIHNSLKLVTVSGIMALYQERQNMYTKGGRQCRMYCISDGSDDDDDDKG